MTKREPRNPEMTYKLTLNEAHLAVANRAIAFQRDLCTGRLTAASDLIEQFAPEVENQDLPMLRYGFEYWQVKYTGTRALPKRCKDLPELQVGDNKWPR